MSENMDMSNKQYKNIKKKHWFNYECDLMENYI